MHCMILFYFLMIDKTTQERDKKTQGKYRSCNSEGAAQDHIYSVLVRTA